MVTKIEAIKLAIKCASDAHGDVDLDVAHACATLSLAWSAIAALLPDADTDTTTEDNS